jgi:tetratricopeptide (TPR) repeat protein
MMTVNNPNFAAEIRDLADRGEIDEAIRRGRERIATLDRSDDCWEEKVQVVESIGGALAQNGDYCAAAIEFERTVRLHRSHSLLPTRQLPFGLMMWGRMLLWTGRPAEAEEKFAEALTLLDHLPAESQVARPFVLVDLAQLLRLEKEHSTAEVILKQALNLMGRLYFPKQHVGFALSQLAQIYLGQGRLVDADRNMELSIRLLRTGNNYPQGFAMVLSANGERLKDGGRIAEARACQEESLAILQKIRKPGHFLLERVKVRLARLETMPTK